MYDTDPTAAVAYLTSQTQACTNTVDKAWWALAASLIAKYADGYINTPDGMGTRVGYPSWWLLQNKYKVGPVKYSKYKPSVSKQVGSETDDSAETIITKHGL